MNRMYPMIPSFEFRRRAREAIKPVMSVLVVVALIAMLPSLISSTVTILTGSDPALLMADLSEKLNKVQQDSGLEGDALTEAMNAVFDAFAVDAAVFLEEKGPIYFAMTLMVILLGPVLNLPLLHALLLSLRKQPFTVMSALGRCRYALKALGVSLLSALKVIVWLLPGYAVMFAAMFIPSTAATLLMFAGMIAAVVMGLMAFFRYALAPYVLADMPETGVLACIRRSCEVMQYRKMELFSLQLSYLGWQLLHSLAQTLLMGMLGSVIGMTLGLMLNLILQVYICGGEAAFYEAYAVKHEGAAQPAAEAPADELN